LNARVQRELFKLLNLVSAEGKWSLFCLITNGKMSTFDLYI